MNFNQYYQNLSNKINNLDIKFRKNKFIIKDGIFTIYISDIKTCSLCGDFKLCDYFKCYHIYGILIKYYKLNYNQLFFLWKNDNYQKLLNKQEFDYSMEECIVCFDKINYYKQFIQCTLCGICYHNKCINKCKDDKCLNCQGKLINF